LHNSPSTSNTSNSVLETFSTNSVFEIIESPTIIDTILDEVQDKELLEIENKKIRNK